MQMQEKTGANSILMQLKMTLRVQYMSTINLTIFTKTTDGMLSQETALNLMVNGRVQTNLVIVTQLSLLEISGITKRKIWRMYHFKILNQLFHVV